MTTTSKVDPFARIGNDAAQAMSSWSEVRESTSSVASSVALVILSLWAHLRRLPEKDEPPKTVLVRQELNQLVEQDSQLLLAQFLAIPPMTVPRMGDWHSQYFWLDEANRLDQGWEHYHEAAPADYLGYELDCWEVFCRLDDYALAVYAANKLLPANHELREKLIQWQKGLEEANAFFCGHLDVFMDAVFMAEPYLCAYRVDLEEFDAELFKTILRHRFIVASQLEEDEFHKIPLLLHELLDGELVGKVRQFSDARVLGAARPRGK